MANIGSASLILKVDRSQLVQGLTESDQLIRAWAQQHKDVHGQGEKGGGGAGGGMMAAGAAGVAMAIGQEFISQIKNVISHFHEMTQSIIRARESARMLGLPTAFMQQMQATGIDGHQLERTLLRLSNASEQAVQGSAQARATFSALGISWRELRGMGTEELLNRVADGTRRIGDERQRLHVLQQARLINPRGGGGEIAELLGRGREGIAQVRQQGQAMGLGVTEEQANAIKEADRAWKRVGASLNAAWEKIVVGLAPAAQSFADKCSEIMTFVQPIAEWLGQWASAGWEVITDAFDIIVEGAKELFRWVQEITGEFEDWFPNAERIREVMTNVFQALARTGAFAFDIMKAGIGGVMAATGLMVEGIGRAMNFLTDKVAAMIEVFADLPLIGDEFAAAAARVRGMGRDVAAFGNDLRNAGQDMVREFGRAVVSVDAFFDRIRARQREADLRRRERRNRPDGGPLDDGGVDLVMAVSQAMEGLERSVRGFGLTSHRAAIAELLDRGATEAMLEDLTRLTNAFEGLQVTDQFRPADRMNREMSRLDQMFRAGSISAEVWAAGVDHAMHQAEQALQIGQFRFAAAMQFGSQQAASTILRAQFQPLTENPQQRLERIGEEQRRILAQQLEVLRQLARQRNPQRAGAVAGALAFVQ